MRQSLLFLLLSPILILCDGLSTKSDFGWKKTTAPTTTTTTTKAAAPIPSLFSSTENGVRFSVVPADPDNAEDVTALADLRYNEWMVSTETTTNPPSRYAFRMATEEIMHERSALGATVLLARLLPEEEEELSKQEQEFEKGGIVETTTTTTTTTTTGTSLSNNSKKLSSSSKVVGAVELSPIETTGTYSPLLTADNSNNNTTTTTTTTATINHQSYIYLTDLLTSKEHRRMGIGKTLMLEAERWARDLNGATHLFFHVKPDNTVAIRMYETPDLGYSLHLNEPPSGWVDLERLAQNAGAAEGQLVMSKSCV